MLPRIACPLERRRPPRARDRHRDLFKYTDTERRRRRRQEGAVLRRASAASRNIEQQPGGLIWALDNWIYTTYNPFRLRWTPNGKLLREETDAERRPVGSAQDDYGKMWFVDGGGESGPVNFQAPIVYGAFNVARQLRAGLPGAVAARRAASPTCRAA